MIKLFVGLGNPGPDYEATRHNAGFWWIDALARELKVNLVPERSYYGLAGRTSVNGQSVWLLQPQTFMNLSGKSVASLPCRRRPYPAAVRSTFSASRSAIGRPFSSTGSLPSGATLLTPAGHGPARGSSSSRIVIA